MSAPGHLTSVVKLNILRAASKEQAQGLGNMLSQGDQALLGERAADLVAKQVPAPLAAHIAGLPLLLPACDITRISTDIGKPVPHTAAAYFHVGKDFGFDWLRGAAKRLPTEHGLG